MYYFFKCLNLLSIVLFLYWCKVELPSHGQRLYIDPCNYEDPEEALKEFAKELDKKWITLEKVIGGGMSGSYIFLRIDTTPENGTGNVLLHVRLSVDFDLSSQGSK